MIIDGNTRTLKQSAIGVPNMSEALMGWMQTMDVITVSKTVSNFLLVETEDQRTIQAVRQPLSQTRLEIKPEGQRAWKWELLHTTENFELDDKVNFDGTQYRIMSKFRWAEYGFFEYEICQNYAGAVE